MIVVAIMAIMASTVVIGFNSFGQTIQLQETVGVITDRVKALELETIRRDYQKNIINFEENFMVVESKVVDATLELDYKGIGVGCDPEEVALGIENVSGTVQLAKRDSEGNNLEITPYTSDETACIDFSEADEDEWRYQLFNTSEKSHEIRLIHFNIRRDLGSELPKIKSGTNYTLEISAPYSKKVFYDDDVETIETVELTLELVEDGESEIVRLQD